jgi:hypothetical protein
MHRQARRADKCRDMASSRHTRDHRRHQLLQTMFAFAAAVVLAVCLSALLSARSQAAVDCTARSMSTSSPACEAPATPN